ncbi:MAG: hypothetical protein J6X51_02145 [Bacteroidales bacterium]|nr:hypothetical protein [Bacteroidales bacterium]
MNELKNKKLLILGSRNIHCDIVRKARQMGIYTVVTDWNDPKDSPAKLIADEYWNVSLMAYDELSKLIREHHIDGVLTGFSETYLFAYQHICMMNNLPCYATKEQLEMVTHKDTFKKMCIENGVPTVPQYEILSFNKSLLSTSNKVIFKPVDNGGSRGICVCDAQEKFDDCYQYALSFSSQKKVIIEKYMECDDVSLEYKIQDGNVSLSSICDRYIYTTSNGGSMTSCLIYPSKYVNLYLQEMNDKVIRMFNNVGLKNGVLFMQAFVDGDSFYFYEMGYRLSGGRHYIFTENQNQSSALEQLINFAITGKMAEYDISERDNPCFKNICSQIGLLCKSRKIKKIKGVDVLRQKKEIIDVSINYKEGDTIGLEGTTAQIFGVVHCVVKDLQELHEIKKFIFENIHVFDENSEDIIIRNL